MARPVIVGVDVGTEAEWVMGRGSPPKAGWWEPKQRGSFRIHYFKKYANMSACGKGWWPICGTMYFRAEDSLTEAEKCLRCDGLTSR
jgi:hypothetical protein